MPDLAATVKDGLMIVLQLKRMLLIQKWSTPFWSVALTCSDIPSQDVLRRRIQRIETLLHGRQSSEPQQSISSSLAGIEKLLGIPPPESETKHAILMPSIMDPIASPTTLPSPAGSSTSQLRPAFLTEANHKRWGAESAIGQSWSKVHYILYIAECRFLQWTLVYRRCQTRWDSLALMNPQNLLRCSVGFLLNFRHQNMQYNYSMHIVDMSPQYSI